MINELAQICTYLNSANKIASSRPEYEKVWAAIDTALYELEQIEISNEVTEAE
jgi:hypothetical protein